MGQAETYCGCERRLIIRMVQEGLVAGGRTPGGHWMLDRESWDAYMRRDEDHVLAIVKGVGL